MLRNPNPEIRKANSFLYYWFLWTAKKYSKENCANKLIIAKFIRTIREYTGCEKDEAIAMVQHLVDDGLVCSLEIHSGYFLHMPKLEDVKGIKVDCYCYECNEPGTLIKCTQCKRRFHRTCWRKNPMRPNYKKPVIPSCPTHVLDYDDESVEPHGMEQVEANNTVHYNNATVAGDETDENGKGADIASDSKEHLRQLLKLNSEIDDVVCMGEVRPPARERQLNVNGRLYERKMEVLTAEEAERNRDLNFCTRCRLMKMAHCHQPPNVDAAETCHLLGFSLKRHGSWLQNDIPKQLNEFNLSAEEIVTTKRLLFKNAVLSLSYIHEKIQENQYTYLLEVLCDLLDLQHNISVFFGNGSDEGEAMKYLVLAISYDISEIRCCADCYRYSEEKLVPNWFTLPCVQRHEVVYAKHGSHSFWPAKVMRVYRDSSYDVRFFGGKHLRAKIKAKQVCPLDTDGKKLKLATTKTMKTAELELKEYQMMCGLPAEMFAFKLGRERIIENVQNSTSQYLRQTHVNGNDSMDHSGSSIIADSSIVSRSSPRWKSGTAKESLLQKLAKAEEQIKRLNEENKHLKRLKTCYNCKSKPGRNRN